MSIKRKKHNPLTSQEAEDDGYGDWLYDQEKDRKMEEQMEQTPNSGEVNHET